MEGYCLYKEIKDSKYFRINRNIKYRMIYFCDILEYINGEWYINMDKYYKDIYMKAYDERPKKRFRFIFLNKFGYKLKDKKINNIEDYTKLKKSIGHIAYIMKKYNLINLRDKLIETFEEQLKRNMKKENKEDKKMIMKINLRNEEKYKKIVDNIRKRYKIVNKKMRIEGRMKYIIDMIYEDFKEVERYLIKRNNFRYFNKKIIWKNKEDKIYRYFIKWMKKN